MDSPRGDPSYSIGDNQLDGPAQSSLNSDHAPAMEPTLTGANGEAVASNANVQRADDPVPVKERPDPYVEQVQNVVTSDIGVQTLLTRLKQSVSSAKEFAAFLQKRSKLEEDHSSGLRKVSRATYDNLRRPEHRQGSFIASYDEITRIHERMADNGSKFASSLHQMHEDLVELAANIERGRKQWKSTGLSAEQRLVDAEAAMRKSKAKYDSLAEDYDRAKTGDRNATKKFGLKGPKSAAQHEEELLRKVQAADADYISKVQTAQATRQELISRGRPDAVKNLQDMIKECDAALTMQMQRFASFNEKLLVSNGMSVSPLKGQDSAPGQSSRSLREAIADINNDGDLNYFVASHSSQVVPKPEIKYERHPTLAPAISQPLQSSPQRQPEQAPNMNSFASRQGPPVAQSSTPSGGSPMSHGPSFASGGPPPSVSQQPSFQQHELSTAFNQTSGPSPNQPYGLGPGQQDPMRSQGNVQQPMHQQQPSQSFSQSSYRSAERPPQLGSLPFQTSTSSSFNSATPIPAPAPVIQQPTPPPTQGPPPMQGLPPQEAMQRQIGHMQSASQSYGAPPPQHQTYGSIGGRNDVQLPPLKPVFGLTLEALFERDGSAVPMVVYQCIQAVDLFGLEVEGIYRLSGTGSHVSKIRAMFDNGTFPYDPPQFTLALGRQNSANRRIDASKLDFRNPEAFFHDVNSVAGLLKQFFRDLPDPLLTAEHYSALIDAAKAEDDTIRRDSLHAIINALPDPNYATLRAIMLHLHRVVESAEVNRMNSSNLAIVWGPTLMGAGSGGRIQDAGWQVKVVQTILDSCYQIFDDD